MTNAQTRLRKACPVCSFLSVEAELCLLLFLLPLPFYILPYHLLVQAHCAHTVALRPKVIGRYRGNFHMRKLPCYEQFLVTAFIPLTWRKSLCDIETCLGALGSKFYHSGIRQATARSTLADANEQRDWRLFADFAQVLIQQAAALCAHEPFAAERQQAACALDSTAIDLCLSPFPWATFRRRGTPEVRAWSEAAGRKAIEVLKEGGQRPRRSGRGCENSFFDHPIHLLA